VMVSELVLGRELVILSWFGGEQVGEGVRGELVMG